MTWEFTSIEDQIVHVIVNNRTFAVNVLSELDPSLFQDETCRLLVGITKSFFDKYKGIPTLDQVKTLITRNDVKDFDILEAEKIYSQLELTPSEIEFILDQVPKFIKLKKFKKLLIESSKFVSEDTNYDKQDDIFNNFMSRFQEILTFNFDNNLGMDIYDVKRRYAILRDREKAAIKPALNGLARYIGGYFPKQLYFYVGDPSVGKSILLFSDAFRACKDGFNVVLISAEMSEESFGLRIDQQLSKTSALNLINGVDTVKILEKRYETLKKTGGAGNLKIKEFPTGSTTVNDIERYIELLRTYEDFVPDFVVVDYGDILAPSVMTGNRYQDQGKVFQELRALGKRHNIPVLTAAQTNRAVRGSDGKIVRGVIDETRLADSFDKIRTADSCMSINVNFSSLDDQDTNVDLNSTIVTNDYYLYLIKNRHGKKGIKIPFTMNREIMVVSDKLIDEVKEDA